MLSIDVGFGNVKAFDGSQVAAFPSVYKEAEDGYSLSNSPYDQTIEIEGVLYHVGKTALDLSGFAPFDREDMFRHKIFTLTAICATCKGDFEGPIALGLPISDYKSMADKLKKLKGEYEVKYNGKKRKINITKISVYAQSQAVYKMLAYDTPSIQNETVGIIDIGQKTVDFAYFKNGSYKSEFSGSLNQGVINAYQSIVSALEDIGYEDVEDYEARQYVDEVPEEAKAAFERMANTIKDRLRRRHWKFDKMGAIYIVGGGTSYIAPYFEDTPYRELDEKTAVFANAFGYYAGEKKG